ncbi:hypothetical protein Syun_026741 [Stephania yunnanensis]|uniref:Sucrase n=1 Tax=Stephania yunnanensis TaxID=152371 RepID=A0AAP0HQN0_9MAGN
MASSTNREDNPLAFATTSSPISVPDYLLDPSSQIGSASNSFQNDGLLGGGGGDGGGGGSGDNSDAEFGFLRQDIRQSPLVGSVELYDRHVFLCYKNPRVWPPRVEAAESDRLPRLLSAAMLARKAEMKKQTRLTICEGHDGTETSNGDVLIFPDMIRYRRLTHFDVDTFVEEVLVKDNEWHPATPEILKGSYVFVCCHGSRDRRCGVCGPPLVARLKEEIDARGLQGQVSVSPCSHIGGHKYAGNVIIFGPTADGEKTGHWYGYVTPEDVPVLIEQHIGKGEIIDRLWRGQMGLSEEDQKKSQELRVQVSNDNSTEKIAKELANYNTSLNGNAALAETAGCCQANGNSSCCQNSGPAETVHSNNGLAKNDGKMSAEKKKFSNKQISRTNSSKGTGSRKVCAMPTWFESWEHEDTYAALAVAGALVSVGIAYHCYRKLRA